MQFHQLKRREFVALLGCAATWPLAARAQEPKRTIRVGFLGAASPIGYEPRIWSLLNGFRDLGYVEGKNFTIEYRWAQGNYERLPELATELVRLNVDVLVTHGTPGTLAAKQATTSIPIVMAASGDAVATGIVPSLSRPGGNVTGSSILNPELVAKRLELVKELVATATQVGFLFNAANLSDRILRQTAEATGKLLRISIEDIPIQTSVEIPAVLSRAARHIDALATTDDGMFIVNTKIIANTATENRLPSIGFKELVQAGGLISYAPDLLALFRHAAVFVDKIVRGAKPGDIPIEQPTKFELALNIKTAKILGLDVPLSFYWRADEVRWRFVALHMSAPGTSRHVAMHRTFGRYRECCTAVHLWIQSKIFGLVGAGFKPALSRPRPVVERHVRLNSLCATSRPVFVARGRV